MHLNFVSFSAVEIGDDRVKIATCVVLHQQIAEHKGICPVSEDILTRQGVVLIAGQNVGLATALVVSAPAMAPQDLAAQPPNEDVSVCASMEHIVAIGTVQVVLPAVA